MSEQPPVRLVWRVQGTATRSAYNRIGPWPARVSWRAADAAARNGARVGSPSVRHAADVWEAARTAASRQAAADVPAALTDLAMVTALGRHMDGCRRCWQTGPLDSVAPADWVTWAVRLKPKLWRIYAPVLLELGVRTGGLTRVPSPERSVTAKPKSPAALPPAKRKRRKPTAGKPVQT